MTQADNLLLERLSDAKLERLAENLLRSAAQAAALSSEQLMEAKKVRTELARRRKSWARLSHKEPEEGCAAEEVALQASIDQKIDKMKGGA